MDYLQEILCEKSALAYHDQAVIRSIFKEFPQVQPLPEAQHQPEPEEESFDF